jgi:hypothetical protein
VTHARQAAQSESTSEPAAAIRDEIANSHLPAASRDELKVKVADAIAARC